MARESMYIADYLAENGRRGWGRGLTPGSYLTGTLRGAQKAYSGGYLSALVRACEARVARGDAVLGPSRYGRDAYYPAGYEQEAGEAA